mmetsp:Transcript_29105/g.61847  ORF Transcript_29105/g.61847 Transcript_29105/m.61847 type:complete len:336 (+) Transcript_29105:57-1064(+)
MGYKGVVATSTLTLAAIVLNAIGCTKPMHALSFFTFFGARIFRGKTFLLSWKVDDYSNDFCKVLPNSVCGGDIHEVHDLQDISQRFCSSAARTFFPTICTGMERAYLGGMLLVITSVINAVMLLIANYMLWDYITRAKKQTYRINATIVMGIAVVAQCSCQTFYGVLVLAPLDDGGSGNALLSQLFAANKSTGISVGYVLMSCSVLVQMIMLGVVSAHGKTSSELDAGDIEDRKERAELLAEQQKMAAYGSQYGGAAPTYGNQYGGAAPGEAMVYGQAPVQVQTVYGQAPPQMMPHVMMQSDLPPQGFMPPMPAMSQPGPSPPELSPPGPMTPAF